MARPEVRIYCRIIRGILDQNFSFQMAIPPRAGTILHLTSNTTHVRVCGAAAGMTEFRYRARRATQGTVVMAARAAYTYWIAIIAHPKSEIQTMPANNRPSAENPERRLATNAWIRALENTKVLNDHGTRPLCGMLDDLAASHGKRNIVERRHACISLGQARYPQCGRRASGARHRRQVSHRAIMHSFRAIERRASFYAYR